MPHVFPVVDFSWHSVAHGAFGGAMLVLTFLAFHFRSRLAPALRMASFCLALVFVILSFGRSVQFLLETRNKPPEWDFAVFWLYGRVTATGANVYVPASYDHYRTQHFSSDFTSEVLDVGSTYPPASMLLFWPLGRLEFRTAYCIWLALQLALVAVSIELLRRAFLPDDGAWGLVLAGVLVCSIPVTRWTLEYAQTNFMVLTLLLLYWLDRRSRRGGVWLALACLVKPWAILLLLYPLILRRLRQVMWFAASGAIATIASLALLGPGIFFSFFTQHPSHRLPAWVFTETANQSLLATVLRLTHARVDAHPVTNGTFVAAAVILTAFTVRLMWRVRFEGDLAFGFNLVLALMLYPGTLRHYGVLLLLPLLVVWSRRSQLPPPPWASMAIVVAICGLLAFGMLFVAQVVTWLSLAAFALRGYPSNQRRALCLR